MIYVKMAVKSECTISRKPAKDFSRAFGQFYSDNIGNFYVKTFLLKRGVCGGMAEADVLVNLPHLDSATLREEGMYLIDKDRVVCEFANSDGGNFVEVRGVDPGTFKVFKNVFGGRDKAHVFFENKMLEGLDPKRVKVYSERKNCANCNGYFKDGVLVDFTGVKVETGRIPKEYVFVE
jgi:hypothetical protein